MSDEKTRAVELATKAIDFEIQAVGFHRAQERESLRSALEGVVTEAKRALLTMEQDGVVVPITSWTTGKADDALAAWTCLAQDDHRLESLQRARSLVVSELANL